MKEENKKEIKEKIIKALSKVELKACVVCGEFISVEEFEAGEDACFKCWSK